VIVTRDESEYKTKPAIAVIHCLTEKVARREKYGKLITKEVHSASYTMLEGNDVSNMNMTEVDRYKPKGFSPFLVTARVDSFPTAVTLER
jgi:hypothetical protein